MLTSQNPPPAPERMDEDELVPASAFGVSAAVSEGLGLALAVRPEGRPQTIEAWQRVLLRQVGASGSPRPAEGAKLEVENDAI